MPVAFDTTSADTYSNSATSLTTASWTPAAGLGIGFVVHDGGGGGSYVLQSMRNDGASGAPFERPFEQQSLLNNTGEALDVFCGVIAAGATTSYTDLRAGAPAIALILTPVSYTGATAAINPIGVSGSGVAVTTVTATVTVTTTAGDVVVAGAVCKNINGNAITATAGAGCTSRHAGFTGPSSGGSPLSLMVVERTAVGATTVMNVDFTFSSSSVEWAIIAFVVSPTAPTTTVKSIGTTGRDYSTITAWEAACPANLTTSIAGGEIWRGECYNDSEFVEQVAISGITTNGTAYVELTVAAGQSFCDSVHPLRYSQSYGVALRSDAFSGNLISFTPPFTRISRLQLHRNNTDTNYAAIYASTSYFWRISNCLAVQIGAVAAIVNHGANAGVYVANCIAITNVTGAAVGFACENTHCINCTSLALAPAPTINGVSAGGFVSLNRSTNYNCAAFGFPYAVAADTVIYGIHGDGSVSDASPATNAGGFAGANSKSGKPKNNQFMSIANDLTLVDARLKDGNDCKLTGTADTGYAPNDIFGTVRATGAGNSAAGAYEPTGSLIPEGLAVRPPYSRFPKVVPKEAIAANDLFG